MSQTLVIFYLFFLNLWNESYKILRFLNYKESEIGTASITLICIKMNFYMAGSTRE